MIAVDIRELKYFVTVVEQRGFTKAAEHLHISQPYLSNVIKRLEQELGIRLIDRSTRSFQVTEEGKYFYAEALKLIRHYHLFQQETEKLKEKGPNELAIGLIESSLFWLPDVIIAFRELYHDINIQLLEILSLHEVETALLNFDIHLAITNQSIFNKDIEVVPLYEEKLVALLPINHPLQREPAIRLQDLVHENFIVCKEGFQTRKDILQGFMQKGLRPNIQFEIERFETAVHLVEKNLGVTIVPENYVKYSNQRQFIVKPIKDLNMSRTVYLAYEKNRFLPKMVSGFIDLVKGFFSYQRE